MHLRDNRLVALFCVVECSNQRNLNKAKITLSRRCYRWKKSQVTVISEIERSVNTFYTRVNGVRANVIVAVHNGNKYIKTENDGLHPNNLLALPECP